MRAAADEIRLKDGKKLYGVIVAYEDNMFKVKTELRICARREGQDRGDCSQFAAPADASRRRSRRKPAVSLRRIQHQAPASATEVSAKNKVPSADVHPSIPANNSAATAAAPNMKVIRASGEHHTCRGHSSSRSSERRAAAEQRRDSGQSVHEFHARLSPCTKRQAGTDRRCTQSVAERNRCDGHVKRIHADGGWRGKNKEPLDAAASGVEKRLREIYDNYRLISQRKTTVGGMPAVEYKYRGMADNHDWSGTLVVISRGKDVLTALGMTFADSDLIQIQENVISRSISSMDFSVHP